MPAPFGGGSGRAVALPGAGQVPAGYHIVYQVTASGISPYREDLWVQRPFRSLDEVHSGLAPGAPVDLGTLSRLGTEILFTGRSQPAAIHVAAAPAGSDARLEAVATAAESAGLLQAGGSARILGRPCRVYRSAASLTSTGPMARPTATHYVLSCVDSQGLVLGEATFKRGHLSQLRRAVGVSVGPGAGQTAAYAMTASPTPFDEGGGSFRALTLQSSPPGTSWEPSWLPAGFRHYGRYAVVPSQPQAFDRTGSTGSGAPSPSGLPASLVTELDDVYVSGSDVIVLQQGVTIGTSVFKAPIGGSQVALGPVMGRGQLLLSPLASSVNAEPNGGSHFVRVSGTVAPGVLLRLTRSLERQAPGQLIPLPEIGATL